MKATIRLKANLTITYACKKVRKNRKNKDDTGFPRMGEEGCGNLYPTRFLLSYYNDLKRKGAFDL